MRSIDGGWGSEEANGSWNGMVSVNEWRKVFSTYYPIKKIGMVSRNEVTIGVSSFFATKERGEVVDFSTILDYAEYWTMSVNSFKTVVISLRNKFFIKFPGRNLGGVLAFFQPLTIDAWLVCLLFLIVVPGILFVCFKVLRIFNIFENYSFGYGQSIFILFNAFSQQVTYSLSVVGNIYWYGLGNWIWAETCQHTFGIPMHDGC